MGGGAWRDDDYTARQRDKAAKGVSAFHYSDTTLNTAPRTWSAHSALNPLGVAVREGRDSDEHPESLAIAVLFDVTGSMGLIPRVLQQKLPQQMGMLLRKGYVVDPQILFGAIGDANCDRVPLQIGQFESDVRMSEHLENLFLEGGGGGQVHETYELGMYFMARHTAIDCWEKRGVKGFLFTIGDEMFYDSINPTHVRQFIGDDLRGPIHTVDIIRELEQRYNYFHIIATSGTHGSQADVQSSWRKALGERVLLLDDPDAVCETIATTIGLIVNAVDLNEATNDMTDLGVSRSIIGSVSKAVGHITPGTALARTQGSRSLIKPSSPPKKRRI